MVAGLTPEKREMRCSVCGKIVYTRYHKFYCSKCHASSNTVIVKEEAKGGNNDKIQMR